MKSGFKPLFFLRLSAINGCDRRYNAVMRRFQISLSFFAILICCISNLSAQKRYVFKGCIADINGGALENACIHNISTGLATFSNSDGNFAITVKGCDTIIITYVGYEMETLIVTDSMLNSKSRYHIRLYMKSIMLKEFTFYALKPYPIFLEDVAKDAVEMEKPITLNEQQKADATANLSPSMLTLHPFSYLYEKYSRAAKMNRLYSYLSHHEDEVAHLNQKFSVGMVSELTGYTGKQLEDFLNECSFSYYQLIQSNEYQIREMILKKKKEYQKKYEQ